ncbi:MAG TPA: TolC family protein [Anaeromyxobacteraceae bacterium]|nr:TolC family protein [Anaeromyxobacteraceae bacterium]
MPTLATAVAALLLAAPGGTGADPPTLTLEIALRELDAQNLTLVQARARADEARAVVRQAASALVPTLSATGSYTRNSDQAAFLRPGAGLLYIQPLEVWQGGAAVHLPLIVPSAWFDLGAARQTAEAAGASAEAARLDIRAAFAQSAWLAGMGEEIAAASERAVAAAREQEQSARRAVIAGTAAPLSVLQARTITARRESELALARSELERARLALGVFLGRAGPVRVTLPAGAPAADLDPDVLASEALSRRPELRAREAEVRSADRQLDSARWRWAPQIAASGSVFAADVPYPTGQKDGWRVTLDLAWPLYDGGYRYGKARQAEAALSGAEAARALERLQVGQEVQNATRDVGVARERVRLGERQQEAAAEAAASARRSFAAGVAGSIEVIDANDRLFQAEVGLADARARLGTALVALDRAVGRSP